MNHRVYLLLALFVPLASACSGGGGAAPAQPPTAAVALPDGGGSGAPFTVNLETPPIGVTADMNGDVTATAATACDKVQMDAHNIRARVCSSCHTSAGAQGAPLTFILDESKLINGKSTSSSNGGKTYVIPGDPDNSLIYRRAGIIRDMPPGSSDVRNASTSLSVSDISVLREWIKNCTGAPAQPASTGSGGTTGDTNGTGGEHGETGEGGTGGGEHTGAGGASNDGAGGTGGGQ